MHQEVSSDIRQRTIHTSLKLDESIYTALEGCLMALVGCEKRRTRCFFCETKPSTTIEKHDDCSACETHHVFEVTARQEEFQALLKKSELIKLKVQMR